MSVEDLARTKMLAISSCSMMSGVELCTAGEDWRADPQGIETRSKTFPRRGEHGPAQQRTVSSARQQLREAPSKQLEPDHHRDAPCDAACLTAGGR